MYKYDKKTGMVIALTAIILLGILLVFLLRDYVNAFVGALILFFLLSPLQKRLVKKLKFNTKFSAILCIILSTLIIIIPLFLLMNLALQELGGILQSSSSLSESVKVYLGQYNLESYISEIGGFAQNLMLNTIKEIPLLFISLLIMYFSLFYLLINYDKVEEKIGDIVPFDEKNSGKLVNEFKNMTYSGVIVTGIIAVLQGLLLTLAFLFFGVPGAYLWGFIGAILSFMPIIGTPLIWIPVTAYYFMAGNNYIGWGMLIAGLIISNIDNILRPVLQHKIGRVHPLISLVGVIMGVPLFGIFGIVVGPLLLSYLLLTIKMFKEEYIDPLVGK